VTSHSKIALSAFGNVKNNNFLDPSVLYTAQYFRTCDSLSRFCGTRFCDQSSASVANYVFAELCPHLWTRFCGLAQLPSPPLLRLLSRFCGLASASFRPLLWTLHSRDAHISSASSHLRAKFRRCDCTKRQKLQLSSKSEFNPLTTRNSTEAPWTSTKYNNKS